MYARMPMPWQGTSKTSAKRHKTPRRKCNSFFLRKAGFRIPSLPRLCLPEVWLLPPLPPLKGGRLPGRTDAEKGYTPMNQIALDRTPLGFAPASLCASPFPPFKGAGGLRVAAGRGSKKISSPAAGRNLPPLFRFTPSPLFYFYIFYRNSCCRVNIFRNFAHFLYYIYALTMPRRQAGRRKTES
jgi:hypothetical protein